MTCSINPQRTDSLENPLKGSRYKYTLTQTQKPVLSGRRSPDGLWPFRTSPVHGSVYLSEEQERHLPISRFMFLKALLNQDNHSHATFLNIKEAKQTTAAKFTNAKQPHHRCNSWKLVSLRDKD